MSFPSLGGGNGRGGFPIPIGTGGGIGLIVLLIVLAVCVGPQIFGGDGGGLGDVLGGDVFSVSTKHRPGARATPRPRPNDRLFGFVNAVVDDVNATWTDIFAESGRRY